MSSKTHSRKSIYTFLEAMNSPKRDHDLAALTSCIQSQTAMFDETVVPTVELPYEKSSGSASG